MVTLQTEPPASAHRFDRLYCPGVAEICFVTRELAPFQAGGIGTFVGAIAPVLASAAEVSVIAPDDCREQYRRLREAGDPRIDPRVEYRFVATMSRPPGTDDADPEPDLTWSRTALEAIVDLHGPGGPDLVEFCDYRADALAAVRARLRDPAVLARSLIAVRAHTSYELCMVLRGTPLPSGDPITAAERQCLRAADALIWPAGDVLATYTRFYGDRQLPRLRPRIRSPLIPATVADGRPARAAGDPLRFLYLGRYDSLKGVAELVEGFSAAESDAWRLTMIGIDTASGPADSSMRDYALGLAQADPRIVARDGLARELIDAELSAHDVIVVPSRYEAWCYVALEALRANRPVLATPVGGLAEVVDEAAGWQAAACSPGALRAALERLTDAPQAVFDRIEAESPRARFEQLTEPSEIIEGYLALAERRAGGRADRQPGPPRSATTDGSTAVILAPGSSPEHRQQALDSIAGQARPVTQVLELDPDGRLTPIGGELGGGRSTDLTGGFAAFAESSGCSYVAVMRADDVLHAEFVAATAAVLDADDGIGIAYTDLAVFGARVAEWVEATSVDGMVAELRLPPSDAVVVRSGRPQPAKMRRLGSGLSFIPRTALMRTDAYVGCGALERLDRDWDHAELYRRIVWGGWRTAYVARALVGCRLVTEADVRAPALAESLLSSLEAAELATAELRSQRDDRTREGAALQLERDTLVGELAQISSTRAWRLRNRLQPVRNLIGRGR